jgi:Family of unknown function (DUF6529)
MTAPPARRGHPAAGRLALAGLLAVTIAAGLLLAGRLHPPDYAFSLFGMDPLPPKSLLATVALGLAGLQVLVALTVPVALHCLIAYGVQFTSFRVAVHSVAGCVFYGAFAAKVLLVRSRQLPGWALPAAGGALALIVGVLWYTSALWYYNGFQLPH